MKKWLPGYHCPVVLVDHHHLVLPDRVKYARIHPHSFVYHIDQHSDLHDNPYDLDLTQIHNDTYLEEFTQQYCNVGNFIQPLTRSNIITHVEQIRTERKLTTTQREDHIHTHAPHGYILDIDLDFWAPEMSISDIPTTYHQTALLFAHASLVTIATSPGFIKQDIAAETLEALRRYL